MAAFVVLGALASVAGAWEVDATGVVTHVVDGDTFDVDTVGRIRLADVDAPEYYEDGYQAAKDFLDAAIYGKEVSLDIDDVYGTDVYDRWVCVVYVRHNATHLMNVNEALLEAGVAVVSDYYNEFNPDTWTLYVYSPEGSPAPEPTVVATANPNGGGAPLTVSFSASVSGGLAPFTYSWTFGDGDSAAGLSVTHTYESPGTFAARVVVTDSGGRIASDTVTISVSARIADADGDGVPDSTDNCPSLANPGQADADQDGLGDACDPTPTGDGVTPRGGDLTPWLILPVLVIVVALVAVVLSRRRKGNRPGAPPKG